MSLFARSALPRLAMASTARASAAPSRTQVALAARPFSSSLMAKAGGGSGPPVLQGEGAKDGEVPTDENQSTGLERFELLGKLQGVDVFDMKPLESDRVGTLKDPIKIQSLFPNRIIGCTGSPAGSHDTIWIHLKTEKPQGRCPECGSVYKFEYIGDPDAHHH